MTSRSNDDGLPQPGDVLAGRYALQKLIGQGGFGAVYVARDATLDRDVAIKILRVSGDDDARALARFLREARATAALHSEHLTTIHEVAVLPDGPAYIAMELLRGRDLHQECAARGRIPVAEAVGWILEASLGLAHAHAVGVVHRDLKPRNIFLSRRVDGTTVVKLLDFGIAKAGGEAEPLTETGTFLGTPRYMSPEQIRSGRSVDARADVWALGVVLYELTTRTSLFDVQGSAELAAHILVEPPVPLRTRVPELPDAFAAVVHRCLEKEPSRRFADLAQLAEALGPFATEGARALAPRIAKVLGAAAGAAGAVAPAGPTGVEAQGNAPTVDAGSATTASIDGAATTASVDGGASTASIDCNLERSLGRSLDAPPRSGVARSATLAVLAIAALGAAGAVGVFVGRNQRVEAAVVPTAASPLPTAMSAAPAAPSKELATPTPSTPASAPAPASASASAPASASASAPAPASASAPAAAVSPRKTAGPTQAESSQIAGACTSRSPTFLVPQNDGPAVLQCGRLGLLGCSGIRGRCATVPITDAEKVSCRDFLAALVDREICR